MKKSSLKDGSSSAATPGDGSTADSNVRVNGNGAYGRSDRGGYGDRNQGHHGDRQYGDRGGYTRGDRDARPKPQAMEVYVENNIEKAMKVLKRKLIKEGLFKELKSRRYFEKPSERRKRKEKESIKKIRKEEARQKKNPFLFS